jgi:hypothetical protein
MQRIVTVTWRWPLSGPPALDLRDRTGPKLHGMQGVKPRRTWLSFRVLDHAAGPVPRGRRQRAAMVGCIVWFTTASSSAERASRSISSRKRASHTVMTILPLPPWPSTR